MVGPKIRSSLQVIAPWLLFFIIDLLKKPQSITDTIFLWYYIPGYVLWIVFTIPAYRLFSWSEKFKIHHRILFLFVLGIFIGLIKLGINRTIYIGFGVLLADLPAAFGLKQIFGGTFFMMEATIISWVMLIVFYVIEISKKYQNKSVEATKLEAELTQANIHALKMQIRPHFIFNAHNAIATLMRTGKNEEALEMLLKLSDLLRMSLNNFENQLISLEEEIDFARKYLEIEQIRFEDRLAIEIAVNEADKNLKVPVFILQPLVENGIIHGVNKTLGKSEIRITAEQEEENLLIKVFNTGTLGSNDTSSGIGLSNVKSRLKTLFKEKARISLKEVSNGVEAVLKLPCLPEKEALVL